jgi:hypothetical protein
MHIALLARRRRARRARTSSYSNEWSGTYSNADTTLRACSVSSGAFENYRGTYSTGGRLVRRHWTGAGVGPCRYRTRSNSP